jgi:hypothetical protein
MCTSVGILILTKVIYVLINLSDVWYICEKKLIGSKEKIV